MPFIQFRNYIIKFLYKNILKRIFFLQNPEDVHDAMINKSAFLGRHRITKFLTGLLFFYKSENLVQKIGNLTFQNPVGLSAGFDKNAQLTQIIPYIGFGFEEVGSIMARSFIGNPKPRLIRLKNSNALLVNYGLKNEGAEVISTRLMKFQQNIPIGINVALTNKPEVSDLNLAIQDYIQTFKIFQEKNVGDYFTINISCPNTCIGQPFIQKRKSRIIIIRDR